MAYGRDNIVSDIVTCGRNHINVSARFHFASNLKILWPAIKSPNKSPRLLHMSAITVQINPCSTRLPVIFSI